MNMNVQSAVQSFNKRVTQPIYLVVFVEKVLREGKRERNEDTNEVKGGETEDRRR